MSLTVWLCVDVPQVMQMFDKAEQEYFELKHKKDVVENDKKKIEEVGASRPLHCVPALYIIKPCGRLWVAEDLQTFALHNKRAKERVSDANNPNRQPQRSA